MKINAEDIVTLSGRTDFGKSFIEENGSDFKVIKLQTWAEHQLLLTPMDGDSEIKYIWINLLPKSRNFKIENVKGKE
tara:strand:- start:292 stop:522 length:231 start_codon:yes stop_codon:yes gene_type:complete